MQELNLAFVVLALGLSFIGIQFDKSMFTFISGFLFLFLAFSSENAFMIIGMLGLAVFQFFNTFWEFRR